MAKPTGFWEDIEALYKSTVDPREKDSKYDDIPRKSLEDIIDEVGNKYNTTVSKGKISEKAKGNGWERGENTDFIKAKVFVDVKREQIKRNDIEKGNKKGTNILNKAEEIANDIVINKLEIEKLVKKVFDKAHHMLDTGKVVEKLGMGGGMQCFQERDLNPSDLKNIIDTIDKGSIAIGVNQRFANINLNQQQNNEEGGNGLIINLVGTSDESN
jgi:hypothetical protein